MIFKVCKLQIQTPVNACPIPFEIKVRNITGLEGQLKHQSNGDESDSQITINRLEDHYNDVVFYDLAAKLNLKNSEQVPKIERIILSSSVNFKPKETRGMVQESYSIKKSAKKSASNQRSASSAGVKAGKKNSKNNALSGSISNKMKTEVKLDIPTQVRAALNLLTGQKPEERLFRVSRPGLNIREGKLAALRVTLRKRSVYFFLDRLISDILPNLKGDTNFGGFKSNPHLRSTSTWLDDGSKLKKVAGSN